MFCADDDEEDAALLSNTFVRTQAASLGPEQHSHRNAVANDNTVDGYVQEERRRYAPATACVRFHAPLQKPPHGLSGIVLAVPQFNSLASLLRDTDMVATVPDYAADVLAAQGGLRVDEMPLERAPSPLSMVWQSVYDNDPAERWLRSRIQMMFSDDE